MTTKKKSTKATAKKPYKFPKLSKKELASWNNPFLVWLYRHREKFHLSSLVLLGDSNKLNKEQMLFLANLFSEWCKEAKGKRETGGKGEGIWYPIRGLPAVEVAKYYQKVVDRVFGESRRHALEYKNWPSEFRKNPNACKECKVVGGHHNSCSWALHTRAEWLKLMDTALTTQVNVDAKAFAAAMNPKVKKVKGKR